MDQLKERILELNQTYNDLGEDLVLLESVLQADRRGSGFPPEVVSASLTRMADYIEQHTEEINQISQYLTAS